MMRKSKCKICNSPDPAITGQVNALLELGVKLKIIAEQVPGFSVYQLSRHRNRCLAANSASELNPSAGSAKIEQWLQRAEDCYLTAQANGDSKNAVGAIGTAIRSLSQLEKQFQREAEAQKSGVDRDSVEFTIKGIDALIRQAAQSGDIENGITPRTLELLKEPVFCQIVQALWANRNLLPIVLAAATTSYLAPKETPNVAAHN